MIELNKKSIMKPNGFNFLRKGSNIVFNQLAGKVHTFIIATLILCTLATNNKLLAQCSGSTQFGAITTPCSGLIQSVPQVPSLRYITVNVINGIHYSFTSTLNGITLRNDFNNTMVDHTMGGFINYTPTFSGLMRIYNCDTINVNATLTYSANYKGSNLQDNEASCGSNEWIGHLYKRWDNDSITPPSDINAFSSYIGYINEPEIFAEDFGGITNCFPTLSNGANVINTYTSFFAAKFCNQSVKPTGAYVFSSVTVDDGLRIYVAGRIIFDRWINQNPTTYNNILFQHSGNTPLELQYFESVNQNILNIGAITRVNNHLSSNSNQTICQGNSAAMIAGTNVLTTAPINGASGYTVSYQWQISSDNLNFTNITGATSQNYTPLQVALGHYYFRRIATITNTNPGSVVITATDISEVAHVVIHQKPYGTITGEDICAGSPAQLTFFASNDLGPFSLIINGITYNNVTSAEPFNIIPPLVSTVFILTQITDIHGCTYP